MKRLNLSVPQHLSLRGVLLPLSMWVMLLGALLLFVPINLLIALKLDALVEQFTPYIALALMASVAYVGVLASNFILDEAIRHLRGKRIEEQVDEKVKLLDPTERALLREFFIQGAAILTLPQDDIVVQSLLQHHIIECVGNERHYAIQGPTADYKISVYARKYLNRRVLRLPSGEMSQDDLQQLMKSRPAFIANLAQVRKHAA
ncbi:superinfection exclusion B family protein [Shewanella avicenniae]|uniref:Superinfection exclusion B family protein n=1 Tax=Shewanella avicenniae TaxID=2814294 RepID=A0ABX7QSA0_9GAMM|nr:superinfection exclusion B family protein [Shewanella avicenniae]QSX34129.1 superinfection exclusion B family protein [Shewanella avicenniae]